MVISSSNNNPFELRNTHIHNQNFLKRTCSKTIHLSVDISTISVYLSKLCNCLKVEKKQRVDGKQFQLKNNVSHPFYWCTKFI